MPILAALLLLAGAAQDDSGARKAAWSKVSSPLASEITAVSLANARLGWALSEGGGVVRTTDGGRTWTLLRPESKSSPSRPFEHLRFESDRRGWIAQCCGECDLGGRTIITLLSTEDGGETWTKVKPEFDDLFRRLVCSSDFTTATGHRFYRSHEEGVYASTPGADSSRSPDGLPGLNGFVGLRYRDVGFVDKDAGVLVGADGDRPFLLRTDNAGKSWSRLPIAGLNGRAARRVWMSAPGELRVLLDGSPSVWTTRDDGKTWSADGVGAGSDQPTEFAFSGRDFGIAVGKAGLILRYSAP